MLHPDRCVIFLNMSASDIYEMISELKSLSNLADSLSSQNSVSSDTTMFSICASKTVAESIVKAIHGHTLNEKQLVCLLYSDYLKTKNGTYLNSIVYSPTSKFDLKDFISHQCGFKNESLCVLNDGNLTVYENNCRGNELKEIQKIEAVSSKVSVHGIFIAIYQQPGIISVYANKKNKIDDVVFDDISVSSESVNDDSNLCLFSEIRRNNVKSMYFLGDDTFLAVEYLNIFDFVCIYNVLTGSCIFDGRILKNKIKMSSCGNFFYLENTNQIFSAKGDFSFDKNYNESSNSQDFRFKMFDLQKCNKKFLHQKDTFLGVDIKQISVIYEFSNTKVILTNEKVKNMLVFNSKNKLIRERRYVNLEEMKFYSIKNRLFCFVTKFVSERYVYTIESFTSEGNITINQLDSSVIDLQINENNLTIFNEKNELIFYEIYENKFNEIKKVQKKHKVLMAIHPNKYNIMFLYDYDSDCIEFYNEGIKESSYPHHNCNKIEWAASGLFCISASVGPGMSGLVQIFDAKGKLRLKRIFNKLTEIEWRPFIKIDNIVDQKTKDKIKNEYEEHAEIIENEEEEFKENYIENKNQNINELIFEWRNFIMERKIELEEYEEELNNH